jgi:hypothetical protein
LGGCGGGCSYRDEEEEELVSERMRARAVEYGRCGIVFKQGSVEWYEGEKSARVGGGWGGQFWEREEKGSKRRGCCQRSTCDYSRVDYLC